MLLSLPLRLLSSLSVSPLSPSGESLTQNFDNSRGAPDKLIRHLHYSNGNGGWTRWSVPCGDALLGSWAAEKAALTPRAGTRPRRRRGVRGARGGAAFVAARAQWRRARARAPRPPCRRGAMTRRWPPPRRHAWRAAAPASEHCFDLGAVCPQAPIMC